MAKRSKKLVRARSKAHKKVVKAGKKMRSRRRSRGLHPASAKRKKRAVRRKKK